MPKPKKDGVVHLQAVDHVPGTVSCGSSRGKLFAVPLESWETITCRRCRELARASLVQLLVIAIHGAGLTKKCRSVYDEAQTNALDSLDEDMTDEERGFACHDAAIDAVLVFLTNQGVACVNHEITGYAYSEIS